MTLALQYDGDLASTFQRSMSFKSDEVSENTDHNLANGSQQSEHHLIKAYKSTEDEDKLCEACLLADYDSVLSDQCTCYHHLVARSTVGAILSNKNCPSCRLLAHLISLSKRAREASKESCVSLWLHHYAFFRRGRSTRQDPDPLTHWIEVHLSEDSDLDSASYGLDDCQLGSLLPVKETRPDDYDRENEYQTPFETSLHDGFIYARSIGANTVDIGLLKSWINFCDGNHDCDGDEKMDVDGDTWVRFIDVKKRCLVISTLREKYVALSYVWGETTKGVLNEDTMEIFQSEGSLSKEAVPRTIFDTMELAERLGEQYLWVDSVCIKQDDINDKQRQLPIMSSIYSHANLVIIAAVDSADEGLPRWGTSEHAADLRTEKLGNRRFAAGKPSLQMAMGTSIWNTRGWTFQEALLARRSLIFTAHQVYWNCREDAWYEDRYTEFKDTRNVPTAHNSLLAECRSEPKCGEQFGQVFRIFCATGDYCNKVEQYSERRFSNYNDVVWAFQGILKGLRSSFPDGFIWALPYEDLDVTLLWQTCCDTDRDPGYYMLTKDGIYHRMSIPSWCWIGKGHSVSYNAPCGSVKSRVKWLDPIPYEDVHDTISGKATVDGKSHQHDLLKTEVYENDSHPFDVGLLHFTAQAAILKLNLNEEVSSERPKDSPLENEKRVWTHVHLPSGEDIGVVRIARKILYDGMEDDREFILLSANTGGEVDEDNQIAHTGTCSYSSDLNVMLIQWYTSSAKNVRFAKRVGLGTIKESAWKEAKIEEKTITLG